MAIANKKTKAKKAAPKKTTKKVAPKKAAPKKPIAKKVVKKTKAKKAAPKKTTVKKPVAKKTTHKKRRTSTSNNVYINNRLVKLPKRIDVESYSCIWRIYRMFDNDTNSYYNKRFWIVIGDGHKKYRKFNNIYEAVRYFRLLKKYARMRVQSVHSKKFIRTVYTFYEMAWSGIELDEIKGFDDSWKTRKIGIEDIDDDDFEDEYTKFDTKEVDYGAFNEEEVNRILSENEGDSLVIDVEDVEIQTPEEEPIEEEKPVVEEKEETRFFGDTEVEKIRESQKTNEVIEQRIEEIPNEYVYDNNEYSTMYQYENPNRFEQQPEDTTNYVEFLEEPNNSYQNDFQDEERYASFPNYEDDEEDFGITQHQTSLTPSNAAIIEGGSHSKKFKVVVVLSLVVVFVILALIILVSLAFTVWKEPFLAWFNSLFGK